MSDIKLFRIGTGTVDELTGTTDTIEKSVSKHVREEPGSASRRALSAGEFQQIAPPLKNTRWKAISCRVEGGDPILATHTGGFPAEARQGMARLAKGTRA